MAGLIRLGQVCPDPDQANHREHASLVKDFNEALASSASSVLAENNFNPDIRRALAQPDDVTVQAYSVGSDGRQEKLPLSPIDVLVFANCERTLNVESVEGVNGIGGRILGDINAFSDLSIPGCPLFDEIELKFLKSAGIVLYHGQTGDRNIWPCRVIDTAPLFEGEQDLLTVARKKLAEELKVNGSQSLGVKIRDALHSRFKEYRRKFVTGREGGTGKNQDVVHYDLDEGVAYLAEQHTHDQVGPSSFKHSALRFIQTTLLRLITKKVDTSSTTEDAAEFLVALPANTCEKIEFLKDRTALSGGKNNLSESQIAELADNYLYFLWLYHRSQYTVSEQMQGTIAFDKQEVQRRIRDTEAICNQLMGSRRPHGS